MLTVQYCDVHVHNRCRGYRWNIVERAISRAATRPSIIGDRISSRFSEFACCKFDIAPTSFSLSLSLFPLFLSRVVSLLSSGGWFDALINDRVDNVGHGVPPIGYRVEWRDIQTFFSPDPCHWFWKLDDFIHFRDQNFEWRADLKFKSIRSDRDHYRNFATRFCADWHIFSHLERRMDTVAFSGSDIGRFDVSERRRGERKRRARLARSWETPFCGYDVSL